MCYVGKATKIFIFIIAVLAVVGLILGFGVFRHGLQKKHKCNGESCQSPAEPLLSSPCGGGNCLPPYTNPIPATATATPPYSPPSPGVITQGPVHSQSQPLYSSPCSGGNCHPPPYPNPMPATAAAAPPPYNPPSPGVVTQGPVHSQSQPSN